MNVPQMPAIALVRRELISSMRRGSTYGFLAVSAGVAIASTWAAFPEGSALLTKNVALSQGFVKGAAVFAFVAGVLFMPGFAVLSILNEREQEMLDQLQLTLIRPFGVIVAKLLNSAGVYLLILTASLPVLGVAFFLVGVDWVQFLQPAILAVVNALLCGSVGLVVGCRSRNGLRAVFSAYVLILLFGFVIFPMLFSAILAPLMSLLRFGSLTSTLGSSTSVNYILPLFCMSPFYTLMGVLTQPPGWFVFFIAMGYYSLMTLALCGVSTFLLRRATEPVKTDTRKPVDDPYKLRQRRRQFPYYLVDPLARVPGIDETRNVVFQKEVYWGLKNRRSYLIRLFIMLLFIMIPVSFAGGETLLRTQITLCVLAAPALLVNTCIKERRQGNLDMLRLTPLKAREIVLGKMRAAAWLLSPIVMSGFVGTVIVVFMHWSLVADIGFVVLQCALLTAVCWFCLAVSMLSSILTSRAATAFVFSYFVCLSLVFVFTLRAMIEDAAGRILFFSWLGYLILIVTLVLLAITSFYLTRLDIYLFERFHLRGK